MGLENVSEEGTGVVCLFNDTDSGMKIQKVLVTGGAGYIGSHCCIELLNAGYELVCADNFYNSSSIALQRVEAITGKKVTVYTIDFCKYDQVSALFRKESIDASIHFAGYKAVGESVGQPIPYYENNINSALNLCKAMQETNSGKNIVFSSSAAVYGTPKALPVDENATVHPDSPYGRTKLFIEHILQDVFASESGWNISILRYFNPVGAHQSGLIGEAPAQQATNLMPVVAQAALQKREQLLVFGDDYPTPDGTGVRDYIHVVDLAKGHISAMRKLAEEPGYMVHNLGTGRGYSVLELIEAFERINGVQVPYTITDRRPGDVAELYASVEKARVELGWEAQFDLEAMVRDTWNWQTQNPDGYTDEPKRD